jgi:hypothetical protein
MYKKIQTFGHVFVQFRIVWHLKTENGSLILLNLSVTVSSRESASHLKQKAIFLKYYQQSKPVCL